MPSFCLHPQITQAYECNLAFGFPTAAPGNPQKNAPQSLILISLLQRTHLPPSSDASDPYSLTPKIQGGYHLHLSGSPHPTHPALISRQNVSLAAVLERRALNFEFSYTFPLNGMARQMGRKKERKKAWEKAPVESWSLGPRGRVSRGRNKVC